MSSQPTLDYQQATSLERFSPHRTPDVRALPGEAIFSAVASRSEQVVPIVERVTAAMEARAYPAGDIFAVRLALEEALVNAIRHGHQGDPTKVAQMRARLSGNLVLIEVEDEGPGFDPYGVADPLAVENMERPCGRGLLLMRHYLTLVRYNQPGNCVTLCKRRSS